MKLPLRFFFLLFLGVFAVVPSFAHAATLTPSPSDQRFETALVSLVNTDRAAQGVTPLATSSLLTAAAQEKANDMMAAGYFAHYSPTGVSPWSWYTAVGYYYTHAGENLAMDFATATDTETAWMASPAHRANLLRSVYTQVGIGIVHGTYLGKPTTFIVQLFATPAKTNPA